MSGTPCSTRHHKPLDKLSLDKTPKDKYLLIRQGPHLLACLPVWKETGGVGPHGYEQVLNSEDIRKGISIWMRAEPIYGL